MAKKIVNPRIKVFRKEKTQRLRKKRANSATQGLKYQLLDYLSQHPEQAFSFKQLIKKFGLKDKKSKIKLEEFINDLLYQDAIRKDDQGNFSLNGETDYVTGRIDFVNASFAFLVSEDLEEDLWISVDNLRSALDGDTVKAQIMEGGKGKRMEGKVVDILNRAKDSFVGKIEILSRYAFVIPDSRKMYYDIYVPKEHILNAKDGDKVVVKLTRFPEGEENPEGIVTQVLGRAGEHETEIHAIMAEYGLPFGFPEPVEAESKKLKTKILVTEIKKRRDFRKVTTFTIDPEDAKDFDDALSVQWLENGNVEIGIHIADVTYYVLPGTELEKEAFHRATSVYLVDRTIPMLPEKLSNELCSLRPNEDKLTFSAVFEIDRKGKVLSEWFGRTVIHSDRRFSYEQAQEVLEKGEGDFAQELLLFNDLAKRLREERMRKGAIGFETVEVKFKLDEKGVPLGIFPKIRKDAHKLIEEFMLLANKKVAEYIYGMRKGRNKLAMVYRIHEPPNEEKMRTFAGFAKKFGYELNLEPRKLAHSLNQMVEEAEGKPEGNALHQLAIRTMSKAIYSTKAIGHFGLAFPHYTHFTSPIRRYPDMMAHRLLQFYLDGQESVNPIEYEAKCKHSSEREKVAADAERASIKYKQVEFVQKLQGQILQGVVTGVTEFGMYVEMIENRCEGLVRMADMSDDYYELDAKNYRIVGRHSGQVISFGDTVWVKVKGTNLERRTIDLLLVKNPKDQGKKGNAPKTSPPPQMPKPKESKNVLVPMELSVPKELPVAKEIPKEQKKEGKYRSFEEEYGFEL
jgi:ribonuclease R